MPVLLSYFLKFSVSLAIVYLFYQLVLRRLTFYNWNRYYLLGYSLLSFIVAFINISPILEQSQLSDIHFVKWMPVLNSADIITKNENAAHGFSAWYVVSLLFIIGILVMFFRLVIQLFSFYRMMRKAELISVGEMKFYQVNSPIIPFSFGNSVFINRDLHSEEEMQEIIRHEFVHVKQKHSFDIICGEILCLFNWYNPFAWLLKRSIRQNLEFIADNKVLENGINKKEYQYLLLKVIGNNQFSIASKFNFSSLKKRIAMMNKMKSARVHIVKFLFILPLLAVMLLAFRNKSKETLSIREQPIEKQKSEKTYSFTHVAYTDTTPETKANKKFTDLRRVSDDFDITDQQATIHLKNGKTEKYNLKDSVERKNFEDKYGKIIEVNADTDGITPVAVVTTDGVKTIAVAPSVVTTNSSQVIAISPKAYTNSSVPLTVTSSASSNVSVNSNVATTITPSVVTTATTVNGTTVVAPEAFTNSSVAAIDDYGYTITGNEDVLVTITRNTTKQDLEDFKKQMKEKGIELNFDQATYNDKGILTHISGTMKANDGNSNFSATDFDKVFLGSIKKGERTYFKVSVQDKKKVVI